ncbi:TATA-box binding protein [Alkalibaculum bacchi]|uniref:TATA-box binding protein n=1 Tax=Alkalibaculum bacchi TaxID=645887 RepID=A0A366HZF4_9FIRM|nr:YwmB family TATA-box binding protein [Alkalibaculum bacchi]RBP58589.1 TATA-box binding protein [Alkalibaculum bacchi]
MKKAILILSLITCISFTIGSAFYPFQKDEEKVLAKSFEATDAHLDSIEVHIDLKTPIDIDEIKTTLNIDKSQTTSIQMPHKEICYVGEQKSVFHKIENDLVTSVDFILKDKKDLNLYREIKKTLAKSNTEYQIFLMYKGSFDREIMEQEMKDITAKALQETNTDFIEGGFIRENFLTTSGYNKTIQNHITTGGNKVNMNIAIKCNADEDRAYVIVGTPLIYGDY